MARTDKAYYEPDSPITVLAAVRDKEGEGTDRAEVVAQVKAPQGTADTVTLAPIAGSAGNYEGTFEPKTLGNLSDRGPGPDRRGTLEGRAGHGRGRQAQPRVRPARPGRRDAEPDRRSDRGATISTSARPIN